MSDLSQPGDTRRFALREGYEFDFKPTMSAKDFGLMTRFRENGTVDNVGDFFELVSGVIRRTLIAADRERWDKVWEEDLDRPITFAEVTELANKVMSDDAGRPTQQPSPSGPSASTDSTRSTDGSDSKERTASPTSRSVPV
jgi:hypothetical protein